MSFWRAAPGGGGDGEDRGAAGGMGRGGAGGHPAEPLQRKQVAFGLRVNDRTLAHLVLLSLDAQSHFRGRRICFVIASACTGPRQPLQGILLTLSRRKSQIIPPLGRDTSIRRRCPWRVCDKITSGK